MAKIKLFEPAQKPPAPPKPARPPKDPPLFDQLFPCSFRGVDFPVTSISISSQQDTVEHKYWNVDGANVEMTGQAPATIEAEIPFVNGIVPGKAERWGVLYPTTFREFLVAFNNKETGVLDTPEFAGLKVKPVSIEFKHDGQVRDGVMVTARWVETNDVDLETSTKVSEIESARLAALTLDAEMANLQTVAEPPEFTETFESLMNDITGIVDTNVSKLKLIANKPNQILYRIKRLQSSIERATNPLTWPAAHACDELEAAVRDLAKTPEKVKDLVTGKRTLRYTAKTRMTLQQIAQATGNSVDDLIHLNPRLLSRPAIPPGSVVRYYARLFT
jgi:prophage DNA circulation protein